MIPQAMLGLRALLAGGRGVLNAAAPAVRNAAARAGTAAKDFAQGVTGSTVTAAPAATSGAGMAGEAVRSGINNAAQAVGKGAGNFVDGVMGAAPEGVMGNIGGAVRHTGLMANELAKAHPVAAGAAAGIAAPAVVAAMTKGEDKKNLHSMALMESGDYGVYQDFLDGAKYPANKRLTRREFDTIRSNPLLLAQFAPKE